MMDLITQVNATLNGIVWGWPALILLAFVGVLTTCITKCFQISHFGHWMKNTIGAIFRDSKVTSHTEDRSISQFQSLCTALAATVGTGNIVGVAGAILVGGPGAVFWMWLIAFFGMMTNYSENVLGIFYRWKNEQGEWCGGAMYYLRDGLGAKNGIINVTYTREMDQIGDLRLISLHGGTAPNVVPASACAKLACSKELAQRLASLHAPKLRFTATECGLFVEAEGESAHGSTPELGENAIGRLVLALDTLPLDGQTKETIHFLAETLGMETDGLSAGIALSDEVSGKLTLNWGTLNVENGSLQMKINYRYPVTRAYDDCAPILDGKFADAGFTKAAELHKAKLYVSEDSELVSTLMKVYREQTGLDGKPKSIGGGTSAKSLPNIVAFGPIFPGDEIREHKPDEFLELSRLMENAQMIAAAMYEMAK